MAEYKLYGTKLIEDDSSLEAFCESLTKNIEKTMEMDEDDFHEAVRTALEDDVSRTDIDYESLLENYLPEIGKVLYEADNNGVENFGVCFFGEGAEEFFNNLVVWKIKYCH